MKEDPYKQLKSIARDMRNELKEKEAMLLFAHNGTGKTRLSMEFAKLGKKERTPETFYHDTLYYNAFTEDLFSWDNDLLGDKERTLRMNEKSHLIGNAKDWITEGKIKEFLYRHVDIDFKIDYDNWRIAFHRQKQDGKREGNIKISRGEESIFIWCFFLAIMQVVLDDPESYGTTKEDSPEGTDSRVYRPYKDLRYIYIDDPISSLDDNHAISVAHDLAQLLKDIWAKRKEGHPIKVIISSHHTLFFNVLYHELRGKIQKKKEGEEEGRITSYVLSYDRLSQQSYDRLSQQSYDRLSQQSYDRLSQQSYDRPSKQYYLRDTQKTPFYYHVAMLVELKRAVESDKLYTYHFNILRNLLEKSAHFHGYDHFSKVLRMKEEDESLYTRLINIMNHSYSIFEPTHMGEDNKKDFITILDNFIKHNHFNQKLLDKQK